MRNSMNARDFQKTITLEDIRRNAPAVFAEAEKETLSDKYLYIPTYKLVEGLERQGFKICGAKQSGSRKSENKEYAKHVVYMTHTNMQVDLAKHLVAGTHNRVEVQDEIPMIALTNSHNGGSSFQIDSAFFRLVCSNGLMMPSGNLTSARIVHKVGMEQDVIEAAYSVVKSFPEITAQVNEMKLIQLNTDEQMLFAEAARNLVFEPEQIELNNKNGIDLRAVLLRKRRWGDANKDLWSTFNAIQENVIKGGQRIIRETEDGKRSVAKMRAVTSIDRDSKLNKELMTLALKFQELKGA